MKKLFCFCFPERKRSKEKRNINDGIHKAEGQYFSLHLPIQEVEIKMAI